MPFGTTKEAEKHYLARTGSSAWEQSKPFAPPGLDTLAESARTLHDFAAAMLVLPPGPGDLVLDLGAGAGWCSDLLGRLNRRAVAVDISLDMLRAGRTRPGAAIRAVTAIWRRFPLLRLLPKGHLPRRIPSRRRGDGGAHGAYRAASGRASPRDRGGKGPPGSGTGGDAVGATWFETAGSTPPSIAVNVI
jgi:hypothetical protein